MPSLEKCPRVDHIAPYDFEEAIKNYTDLLDLYTECRIRQGGLVDYELRKK